MLDHLLDHFPALVSNVSVKLAQRPSKARADGTIPVELVIIANRKSRRRSTGVAVEAKHWNPLKQKVRVSHDLSDAYNADLLKQLNEAREAALGASTARAVKASLDGPTGSMTGYFETFIDRLRSKGDRSHWEVKKYSTTLAKLREALGEQLVWAEVDRDALSAFERYCREERSNSPNTVRKELTRLRRVYKEAIRDGMIKPADDPFLVFVKPKGQRVERRKLTLEDVQSLSSVGPEAGVAEGSVEAVARDAFVFSFYCGGMRFGDVARLKAAEVRGGRAEYRMLKTGTLMNVQIPPPAAAIVARYAASASERGGYLFPLLRPGDERDGVTLRKKISSRNSQANAALKQLAARADIESNGLSFHVARHSFADYARIKSGDLYAISKSLGHGDLKTTETYLQSFDQDAVDKLGNDLWT